MRFNGQHPPSTWLNKFVPPLTHCHSIIRCYPRSCWIRVRELYETKRFSCTCCSRARERLQKKPNDGIPVKGFRHILTSGLGCLEFVADEPWPSGEVRFLCPTCIRKAGHAGIPATCASPSMRTLIDKVPLPVTKGQ